LPSGAAIGGFAEKTGKKVEAFYPNLVKKYYFFPFEAIKKYIFFLKKNISCKINKLKVEGWQSFFWH